MDQKYPITGASIPDTATKEWYETEQFWNCEPEDLRKLRVRRAPRKRLSETNRHR